MYLYLQIIRTIDHVVASKGHLECLNIILLHGVDLTAPDAAGRNALHLSAKYGHSCVCRNCFRTALHDAAMSDCCSSVQLLCDHGASVNAKDGDGRTPLALSTQMCRPAICQLLIDKGADINAKDKQNKTPLMLGCEYGCREAVEVLLRAGADIGLVDSFGHDCAYYSRIGDNLEILSLIKTAMETSLKVRPKWLEPVRRIVSLRSRKTKQNSVEDSGIPKEKALVRKPIILRERMRKMQHEQRILFEKVEGLQMRLNQKEHLKSILETKEKELEESLRTMESLRSKLRYYEGRGDCLFSFAAKSHLLQSPPYSNGGKGGINEAAQELSRKSSECFALASDRDRCKVESDQQIRQLEEALRVNFSGSSRAEDMHEQLREVKGKYEGASAENMRCLLTNEVNEKSRALEMSEGELNQTHRMTELDLEKLQEEKKRLTENLTLLQASSTPKERYEKELKAMQTKLWNWKRNLLMQLGNESHLHLLAHHKVTSALTSELEMAKTELETLKRQLERKLIEKSIKECQDLRFQLKKASEELLDLQAQISKLKSEIANEYVKCNVLEGKMSELQTEAQISKRQTAQEQEKFTMQKQLVELHARLMEAEKSEVEVKKRQEALQEQEKIIIEHEIAQLKGRYDESLATIEELKGRILQSAKDLKDKDKERQLEVRNSRKHQEIIAIYRSHLLNAVQGHMDADVQDALLQIIHMRQELVC
ncbi:hypothetical protein GDO86_006525 [Hymenochirus boettgeri]|uniref:Uveal autoantigen with coiled-coil domains and ankyrin repeats n=1 Tax=Hymenochirus boettgeri TaxID=247094 RepID=A0A8T2JC08_9PIPI|nr:hypothetical protein GDO86_006525 [Hymenochirus boettgeri]